MPDATGLVTAMKQASLKATHASKPTEISYGTVTSASPLQILVDQKFTLTEAQLVLTRSVTDYQTEVTVSWETEDKAGGSGEEAYEEHRHDISGRKRITVHNGLTAGEKVILFRQQGGQKYVVIDRVGG